MTPNPKTGRVLNLDSSRNEKERIHSYIPPSHETLSRKYFKFQMER